MSEDAPARGIAPLLCLCIQLLAAGALCGYSQDAFAHNGVALVRPGLTQTELQALLGPPDYIQLKGRRQAWQYCDHLLYDQTGDLYVTVWFFDGLVEHMRALPEDNMGGCEEYIAMFRWEDVLDGQYPVDGEYMSSGNYITHPPRKRPPPK
jgi:hypothetical protein